MRNEIFIVSNDAEYLNLQQQNRLKGLAMQELVKWTFDKMGFKANAENEIKSLIKELFEEIPNHYIVKEGFGVRSTEEIEAKWYKKGYILKEEYFNNLEKYLLITKKDGVYQILRDKTNNIVLFSKKELLDYLEANSFIDLLSAEKLLKRRLDLWRISNGELIIYESKNKERTKLYFSDIYQVIGYVRILKNYLDLRKATIIVNGHISKEMFDVIENYKKYRIYVKTIKNWIEYFYSKMGYAPYMILIKEGENKYEYYIKTSRSFPDKIIIKFLAKKNS